MIQCSITQILVHVKITKGGCKNSYDRAAPRPIKFRHLGSGAHIGISTFKNPPGD